MMEDLQSALQEVGLLPAEAQIYLALVRNGALGATAIATVTGFPRSSVYHTLNSLLDKGLIEGGAGHGSRFAVVPPDKALPSLVLQEKEAISQREKIATHVGQQLSSLVEPAETGLNELIQVIRSPRAVAERIRQLQLEATRQIDTFTKGPFFNRSSNPEQIEAARRGVHFRSLYERAALEDPAIKPYVAHWIASGEEARVYEGELPHKLAIFDMQIVLLALPLPGDQTRTLLSRSSQLAKSLTNAFEFLWERAQPLGEGDAEKKPTSLGIRARRDQRVEKTNSNRAPTPAKTDPARARSRDGKHRGQG